jgi:hypothetical protein
MGAALLASACAPRSPDATEPPETRYRTLAITSSSGRSTTFDLRHQGTVGETRVAARATAVWAVLPSVFEQLQIQVTRIDPSAGVMGNPGYRVREIEGERLSRFLDCGRGPVRPNADVYEVTLSVLVQLLPLAEDVTTVRTLVDGYARDRALSGGSVHCISWGSLERRIGELVVERLDG